MNSPIADRANIQIQMANRMTRWARRQTHVFDLPSRLPANPPQKRVRKRHGVGFNQAI
jgi:hypothetical protein